MKRSITPTYIVHCTDKNDLPFLVYACPDPESDYEPERRVSLIDKKGRMGR